jgi:hypothetical protein
MVAFGAGYTWGAAKMNWTLPTPEEITSQLAPASSLEATPA